MSGFAATMTGLAKTSSRLVVISHYCGLHANARYTLTGPDGMLRSLIVRLAISQREGEFGVLSRMDDRLITSIQSQHIFGLCEVVRELLSVSRGAD